MPHAASKQGNKTKGLLFSLQKAPPRPAIMSAHHNARLHSPTESSHGFVQTTGQTHLQTLV